MTQEQKVRTRDEQVRAIANAIRAGYGNLGGLTHVMAKELTKAEARGAEEQRRKDGEGVVYQTLNENGEWTSISRDEYLQAPYEGRRLIPANVAALEARVKVLEADQRKDQEVIHWLAEKLKQTDPEAKADYELLACAALTREGGE